MINMKRAKMAFALVLAGAGIAFPFPAFAADAVVARVNGAVITSVAVSGMMDRLRASRGHGPGASMDNGALGKEALEQLIFEELAYQKAKAESIGAGPEEVDRNLEELKARIGGAEGMKKFLDKEKRTEEGLRSVIEREIVIRRIFAREVSDKVALSEDDIAREYEREKGKFVKPGKVIVDDIVFFLKPGEGASVEQADRIRRKVLEDKDRNPRNLEPDGTFIVQEIELRPEKHGELYREAIKMKTGELSGIIETGDSLHILRLKEFSATIQFSLNQVRGFIERKRKSELSRQRLRQWDAELRKGATIEIMDAAGRKP